MTQPSQAGQENPPRVGRLRRFFRWFKPGMPRNEKGRIRWIRLLWLIASRTTVFLLLFSWAITLIYKVLPVPATPLMFIRSIEQARDSQRDVRWKRDWVSFKQLSPHLQLAVICAEDQRFLDHSGFDIQAIEKAYKHNQRSKRKRGASTISQQTAKNVFLWPKRSWLRKGLEVYFTFLVETCWSKKRIMTVYLNNIEFGDGIYGAEAAAQHFFKKSARNLSRQEAALLAAVLPNPLRYSAARPSAWLRSRQQWILRQMDMWGGNVDYDNPNTPEP